MSDSLQAHGDGRRGKPAGSGDVTARRQARRDATLAARKLVAQKVTLVADLGEAATRRDLAVERIAQARVEASKVVEEARLRGERIKAAARKAADDEAAKYATTYRAALAGGWTPDQLSNVGYDAPPRARTRRESSTSSHDLPESQDGSDSGPVDTSAATATSTVRTQLPAESTDRQASEVGTEVGASAG